MKYAFINRHRRVWSISVQCRLLEASVAGYHEHFVRRASAAQRRHLRDDALLVHIKAIHAETHGGYGWPRTWKELLARGIRVGKQRVQKLMQLHGIRAKGKQLFPGARPAVAAVRFSVDGLDVHQQRVVAQVAPLGGTGTAYEVLVIPGNAGLKHPALHRDRPHPPVTVDEGVLQL